MRIRFDYAWNNEDKTVIRYTAHPDWNWKDYHAVVHASLFAIQQQEQPVDVILDFTNSQRQVPPGIGAHARTFGKKHNDKVSGRVVVIGLGAEAEASLSLGERRTLTTKAGEVVFVDTEPEAQAAIAAWAEKRR